MRKLKLRGLKDTSTLIQLVKIKGFKLRFDSAQSLFFPTIPWALGSKDKVKGVCMGEISTLFFFLGL